MKTILTLIVLLFCLGIHAQRAGDLNTSFGENGIYTLKWEDTIAYFNDLKVMPDGSLLMPGRYSEQGADLWQVIVMSLDDLGNLTDFGNFSHGFQYGFTDYNYAEEIIILPDGKILVAGVYRYDTQLYPYILRLLPDGKLDPEFGFNGICTSSSIIQTFQVMNVLQLEETYVILIGGRNELSHPQLLMIDEGGEIVTSFGTGGVFELAIESGACDGIGIDSENNKLYIGGTIWTATGGSYIARLSLPGGIPDNSFGVNGYILFTDNKHALEKLLYNSTDNTLTLFGQYEHADGDVDVYAYRMLASNGNADPIFGIGGFSTLRNPGENEYVADAILQSDGKYYFSFRSSTEEPGDFITCRLNANGYADTSFGASGFVITDLGEDECSRQLTLNPTEEILYLSGDIYNEFFIDYTIVSYHTGYSSNPSVTMENNLSPILYISPNPSSGLVNIETGITGFHRVQVLDPAGKELIINHFTGDRYMLDLEALEPSLYFIKVTMPDNQSVTGKLIRQ